MVEWESERLYSRLRSIFMMCKKSGLVSKYVAKAKITSSLFFLGFHERKFSEVVEMAKEIKLNEAKPTQ